jgi:MFS family permease
MTTAESADSTAAQISLLRHKQFALYWLTRVLSTGGYQIISVAIDWQIYQLTESPLLVGLTGLILFIPVIAGTFVIGHVADHYDRRWVIRVCQVGKAAGAALLLVAGYTGYLNVTVIYFVVFLVGTCRAFEGPTLHTIPPSIMPREVLSRAIAAGTIAQQMAQIGGPFLGGLLLAAGTNTVYYFCLAAFLIAAGCISLVKIQRPARVKKRVTLETALAGFTYITSRPIILGAISLDLAAVLLGGVAALLPFFAEDILKAGPLGFGFLRGSPAIGALMMGFFLANMQINKHAGRIMVGAVAIYGLATAGFGLVGVLVVNGVAPDVGFTVFPNLPFWKGFSIWLWLSIILLAITGAADSISVVVRHSLVQTRTPNDMLGRVMAVNSTFTGTTSNLGRFESGLVAALLGVGPSVLVGGIGAAAVAILWIKLFPDFWRVQSVIPEK